MTSKERFLTAMRNEVPDRVPVTPDISNYIPAKRTGRPFWDIYFRDELPLWKAYLDAGDYFKLDMWIASCAQIPTLPSPGIEMQESLSMVPDRDAMVRTRVWHTPEGDLEGDDICFRHDPPTHRTRVIKNLETDWPKLRCLLTQDVRLDLDLITEIRSEVNLREQAFGLVMTYPGFQSWEGFVEGGIQTLSFAFADGADILDEWAEIQMAQGTDLVSQFLETKPDYVLFGGSGTLTLASPELARRYALPSLRLWSAMARDAGVPTMVHSCGRSQELVRMLVEETDVSCVNPLEVPPMGDADLAQIKEEYGDQIALMGNLHTTDIMLRGSEEEVLEAARTAILAAKSGGGFILSTGDQCPRDTPDANLFALHRAVEEVGRY